MFPLYHEPFIFKGTTIANRGNVNIFGNYFYLSISRLTVLYIAFSLAKFLFMIKTNFSRKQTPNVTLTGLLSGVCFPTGGLKFLINRKVWYSLEMRKLICIPLLNNWGALWLRKPFSQKSYSLDSMHAKAKTIIEGCPYCLHVSSEIFFRIPYFTSYIDVNRLPLRKMCNNLCVLWVT